MLESLKKIFFLLKNRKKKLINIYISFIFISFLDLLGLGLIGPFISIMINKENINLINYFNLSDNNFFLIIGGVIIFLFIFKIILSLLLAYRVIKFGQAVQVDFRIMILKKLYSLPFTQLNKKSSSEYLNIQQSIIPIFTNNLMGLLQLLGDLIIACFITIYLFLKNPFIFFIMVTIISVIIFCYDLLVKEKLIKAGEKSNFYSAKMILNVKEALRGFKEFKVFNKENKIIKILEMNSGLYANAQTSLNFLNWIPRYLVEIILILSLVIFIMFIHFLYQGNIEILLPTIGVFAIGAVRLLPIARNISYILNRLNSSKNSIDIIYDLLKINRNEIFKNIKIKKFKNIKLKNIYFKYDKNKKHIFQNLNLFVTSRQKILICGDSGKGKTTLLNIILGFLKPNNGKIIFNDKEVKSNNSIWQNMAYLPQDVFILEDTLEKNITLGEKVNQKNILKFKNSIRKSGLNKFILELPNGIKSHIGENGMTVSGGQKQRIALARAFYFEKDILILDEATSSLDKQSENEIFKQIKKLKDVTLFVISHKKVPFIKFDKIINLN